MTPQVLAMILAVAWRPLQVGILLGLGAALPIGPVNVQIARRVIRHGFWSGAALGFGAVTVDVIYAMASAFSFTHVLTQPTVIRIVGVAGAALLAYMGVQCLQAAWMAWKADPLDEAERPDLSDSTGEGSPVAGGPIPVRRAGSPGRNYLTGVLMTLLNPMTLLFWFVVLPTTGSAANGLPGGIAKATTDDLPMIATGVFIGTVSWVLVFSSLLAWASRGIGGRHDRRRKWLAFADTSGGVMLLGFAVMAGWRVIRM